MKTLLNPFKANMTKWRAFVWQTSVEKQQISIPLKISQANITATNELFISETHILIGYFYHNDQGTWTVMQLIIVRLGSKLF